MFEPPAAQLAVASLTETSDAAAAYRHTPDRPLRGYCLVTGDEHHSRVTVYLENGRTLSSRSAMDRFYYEGWLIADDRPVSIGAFNTGSGGEGAGTCARETWALHLPTVHAVRITAEPFGGSELGHTPVLEGKLIWLQGKPVAAAVAAPGPAAPVLQGAAAGLVPEPWAGLLAGAGAPATALPSFGAFRPEPAGPEPAATEPNPEPAAGPIAALESHAEAEAEVAIPLSFAEPPASQPEPQPQPDEEPPLEQEPAEIGFKLYPEPAVEVMAAPPQPNQPQTAAFATRHPMAPRAGGSAVLRRSEGSLILNVRGLPTPAALGRDPSTDRPYNAYRLWLVSSRTGQREPLGLLTRIWGENFRYESREELPLTRFDTILITADDRSQDLPNPAAPQVLIATY